MGAQKRPLTRGIGQWHGDASKGSSRPPDTTPAAQHSTARQSTAQHSAPDIRMKRLLSGSASASRSSRRTAAISECEAHAVAMRWLASRPWNMLRGLVGGGWRRVRLHARGGPGIARPRRPGDAHKLSGLQAALARMRVQGGGAPTGATPAGVQPLALTCPPSRLDIPEASARRWRRGAAADTVLHRSQLRCRNCCCRRAPSLHQHAPGCTFPVLPAAATGKCDKVGVSTNVCGELASLRHVPQKAALRLRESAANPAGETNGQQPPPQLQRRPTKIELLNAAELFSAP